MTTLKTILYTTAMAILMTAYVGTAQAGVVFNPGDSFDDFTVGPTWTAPGDYGVEPDQGPTGTGDSVIFFVPRNTNDHTITWDVAGVMVDNGDTLKLDVRNVLGLGVATLTVRVYYDGLPTPHSPVIPELTGNQLLTDDYENITVPMPGGDVHELDKIVFLITENTKVVYLDNLTLTTFDVPEPGSLSLAGLGAATILLKRRRK